MNTSFSALETFQNCPLKYKFSQIDKIKTPQSPEAFFGTIIHSTLKFALSGSFILPTLKDSLEYFSTHWNSEVFENELAERSAFAQGIKIIQDFYQHNDIENTKIVDLESRFAIEIKDQKESHIISGIIDRIDRTADGYEIIDYKTTRKLPAQEYANTSLQLLIYLLALLKRYPDTAPEKITLSLYYLKHSAKLSTKKTEKQIEAEKNMVLDIIHQIKNSSFEAKLSPLCDWCGYQEICPMWKHKFVSHEKPEAKSQKELVNAYVIALEKSKLIKEQIAKLQESITKLMEQEQIERIFGDNFIISKIGRKTYKYDENKIKNILNEYGRLMEAMKIDQTKLKKVAQTLPPTAKNSIESARYLEKESFTLNLKKA